MKQSSEDVLSKWRPAVREQQQAARLMVEVGKARVEVSLGFDRGLLRQVLSDLGGEA